MNEKFINSKELVGNWIENANRIWESLAHNDPLDKTCKPAFDTWNDFVSMIDKNEMIESIIKENWSSTENFTRFLKSGLDGYSFFQCRWIESTKNILKIINSHKLSKIGDPEIFDIYTDIYTKEFSKFFSVPPLGLSREYQSNLQQVVDKANIFHVKLMEFLYFLYIPFEKSFKVVQESLSEMVDKGNFPEDSKSYYQLWLKQLENHYMVLFKSIEYRAALGKVIDAMSDFMSARQQIIQDTFKSFGVPIEQDLDELYKDIYSLKKRIRELERESKKRYHESIKPSDD